MKSGVRGNLLLGIVFVLLLFAITTVWWKTPAFIAKNFEKQNGTPIDRADSAGTFGDQFGSVNALFSGLAFAVLIMTLLLQMKELRQNTKELKTQARALEVQAELMRLSAQLNALPILIDQEKSHIETVAPTVFKNFTRFTFSIDQLNDKIEGAQKEHAQTLEAMKRVEEGIPTASDERDSIYSQPTDREILQSDLEKLVSKATEYVLAIESLQRLKRLTADLASTFQKIESTNTKLGELLEEENR